MLKTFNSFLLVKNRLISQISKVIHQIAWRCGDIAKKAWIMILNHVRFQIEFIHPTGGFILMLTFGFHFTHQFWTQWPKLDYITYLMKLEQSLSLKFLSPDINLLSMYGFCLPWIYLFVSPYLIIVIAFIMKNCRGLAISKYHPFYWKDSYPWK